MTDFVESIRKVLQLWISLVFPSKTIMEGILAQIKGTLDPLHLGGKVA